jgi:hypothetical protein
MLLFLPSGCGRKEAASPATAVAIPAPRRLNRSDLVLPCAHVVVAPDLIRGVLTARNIGREPLALVDRWNSWRAFQCTLETSGGSAGNPQRSWDANDYTETRLAPGEVRHVRFCVTASRTTLRVLEDSWWFLAGESFRRGSLSEPPLRVGRSPFCPRPQRDSGDEGVSRGASDPGAEVHRFGLGWTFNGPIGRAGDRPSARSSSSRAAASLGRAWSEVPRGTSSAATMSVNSMEVP